jgi:hypothetical protein
MKIREWFTKNENFGDIDIFLYGLSDRQATRKVFEIHESIKKVCPGEILCVRGPRAITFITEKQNRHIQIILRNYKTKQEILASFDVDCCAFGYDGSKVLCTPRGLYAMTHGVNIVDVSKKSDSYEYRLAKYGKRGYAVYLPCFNEDLINEQIFIKPPYQLRGLAKLLALEKLDDNIKFQIYRDVIDSHQASMRRNISLKAEYEITDYSKIYLPKWNEGSSFSQILEVMKKKHAQLNANSKVNRYFCFAGSLNDVVMKRHVEYPEFTTPYERISHMKTYVNEGIRWYSITDTDFKDLGIFSSSAVTYTAEDILEWYQTAYNEDTFKNQMIECVICNNGKGILEILKNGKQNRTDEEYEEWKNRAINSRDIANRVPLHQSIIYENEEIVKILLANGADIFYVSKLGKTSLHTACEKGNLNIVKMLVNSVGDKQLINVKDSYKLTPILYALMYGNKEVFSYMYKYVENKDLIWEFKYDKNKSYRALKMCLMFRQYDIANFLLSKEYDVNDYYIKRKGCNHIIEDCVKMCDYKMFEMLLLHGEETSTLKYDLPKLVVYSKMLQDKYNKSHTKQDQEYYIKFITKMYETHSNKSVIYKLLLAMITYHRLDQLENYINNNNVGVNLLIVNEMSLLDEVERRLVWFKKEIDHRKLNIKQRNTVLTEKSIMYT